MSAKSLDQYNGPLTPAQVSAGMNAALRNAKRLADDAKLLLDNKRYGSAAALAILSIEEAGKMSILRGLAVEGSGERVKWYWREYRSHTRKNCMGMILDFYIKGARRLHQFAPLFYESADHPQLLNQVKQIALYSDCLRDAHWSEPHEVIEEALARSMVLIASLLAKKEEVTTLEIELWVTHVGPHIWGEPGSAERGLVVCYAEMQRHGLAPPGNNAMEQFITGGVSSDAPNNED